MAHTKARGWYQTKSTETKGNGYWTQVSTRYLTLGAEQDIEGKANERTRKTLFRGIKRKGNCFVHASELETELDG